MKLTFRYYNCVPQTVKLNRGIWKTKETEIRKISQNDSLFVIIINKFGKLKIGKNVGVPEYCIKATYSLTTLKPISVFYVTNTNLPFYKESTISQVDSLFSIKVETFLTHYLKKDK
jgi:DNA/RNA endonuclease G (NUC1)